jgi:hypothetical protein
MDYSDSWQSTFIKQREKSARIIVQLPAIHQQLVTLRLESREFWNKGRKAWGEQIGIHEDRAIRLQLMGSYSFYSTHSPPGCLISSWG